MISFTVLGEPVPQGSMWAFTPKHGSRPIVCPSNQKELKLWRKLVSASAIAAVAAGTPAGKHVPVRVKIDFYFERPKSVKRAEMVVAPDSDKLARGILDGMTGIVYHDDAQVVELIALKHYGSPSRAEVEVEDFGVVPVAVRHEKIKDSELPF